MRVAVVYESLYGNTHEIAASVAAGVTEAQPDAQVDVLRVGEADPARAAEADLLIVGGPTHMRGMTTGLSRKLGVSAEDKKEPSERHDLEPTPKAPGSGTGSTTCRKPPSGGPPPPSTPASARSWPAVRLTASPGGSSTTATR